MPVHSYRTALQWSGSTSTVHYDRAHDMSVGPAQVRVSADPAFRGDAALMNPEQMLVAAASSCQLLSFLALAAGSGVDVQGYSDDAEGQMSQADRPMRLTEIVLRPHIVVRGASPDRVERLLHKAHQHCYIANSLTSHITLDPTIEVLT